MIVRETFFTSLYASMTIFLSITAPHAVVWAESILPSHNTENHAIVPS